jgi:hypothetical protein
MTVAQHLATLLNPLGWATFTAIRGHWFSGPRHSFGAGGVLAVLFLLLLIFLCIRVLVSGEKTQ